MVSRGTCRLSCGQPTRLWITQEALAVVPVEDDEADVDDVDDEAVEDDAVDVPVSDVFDDPLLDVDDDEPPSPDFDSELAPAVAFFPSALLSVR